MKKIWILFAALALLLTGCGNRDKHPEWNENWTRFADLLAVETPDGYIMNEYNDALSVNGIWYAAWSCGETRTVQTAEDEEAAAYDAQIFLLIKECGSESEAEHNVADWTVREAQSYEAEDASTHNVGDQSYRVLILKTASADNPYSHGAAAFGLRGELAISAELLCAEGFEGDAQTILEQFLSGIHYGE